jgi:tetratricopeptide (TPR) repeat protein
VPGVEWEFSEDPEGDGGQFQATDQVLGFVRNHLGKGDVDKALDLYESCNQDIGAELFAEFATASKQMRKNMATLFLRARDYGRAAHCFEQVGEWIDAARAYESASKFDRAARCYLQAGDKDKAASLLQKAGQSTEAAKLLQESEDIPGAAQALEVVGDLMGAALLYIEASELRKAAQVLSRVPATDPRYIEAMTLLAELQVSEGRADLAIQRLASVLPLDRIIRDETVAQVGYRLGVLLQDAGRTDGAIKAFEMVVRFSATFKDAGQRINQLGGSRVSVTAGSIAPAAGPVMTRSPSQAPPPVRRLQEVRRDRVLELDEDLVIPERPSIVIVQGTADLPTPATESRDLPTRAPVCDPALSSSTPPTPEPRSASFSGDPFAALDRELRAPPAPAARLEPTSDRTGGAFVMRMEGYEVLKTLPLFEGLALTELKDLYHLCEQASFTAGQVLIEPGRPSPGLFIVREGSVRVSAMVSHREVVVETIGSGRGVGELSLIEDGPELEKVSAAQPSKTLFLSKSRFQAYLFSHERVALSIYRSLSKGLAERLREAKAKLRT